jgi:hypothetical protein
MLPVKILQADLDGQTIDVGPATGFLTQELPITAGAWEPITVPAGVTAVYLAARTEDGSEWKFSTQAAGTAKITIPVSNGFEVYAPAGTVIGYAQGSGEKTLELLWSIK